MKREERLSWAIIPSPPSLEPSQSSVLSLELSCVIRNLNTVLWVIGVGNNSLVWGLYLCYKLNPCKNPMEVYPHSTKENTEVKGVESKLTQLAYAQPRLLLPGPEVRWSAVGLKLGLWTITMAGSGLFCGTTALESPQPQSPSLKMLRNNLRSVHKKNMCYRKLSHDVICCLQISVWIRGLLKDFQFPEECREINVRCVYPGSCLSHMSLTILGYFYHWN